MSLEGLMALLLIIAGLVAFALWRSRKASAQLLLLEEDLRRAEASGQEQATRIAALESLRDGQQLTEQAIAVGTAVVKEMHKGIADIPFSVFEAIPATARPAKLLHGLHDSISDGVYSALGNLNKAVGRELRKAGASSESQSLAADGRPDATPAAPSDTDDLSEPGGESSPTSALPPKSWG